MNSELETMFALAYGDSNGHRCRMLHFRTESLKPHDAARLVELIGKYNNFTPRLAQIFLMKYATEISYVELGRESSPVMYIHLPYWTHQRAYSSETNGEPIPCKKQETLVNRIMNDAREFMKADEIDDHAGTIRIWWD